MSQPAPASSELPDNGALFQRPLWMDDGDERMRPHAKGYQAEKNMQNLNIM